MQHVSYQEIRSHRRTRKVAAIISTVGTVVVLTAAVGHATASAHGRRPTLVTDQMNDQTNDDMTTSMSDPPSSMAPPSSSMTTGAAGAAAPASTDDASMRSRARFGFRTIDDALDPTFNQLLGINDKGRIVGYYGSGADAAHPNHGYRVVPPYDQKAFFGKDFPGAVQTQAVGVNNAAVVVGFYVDGNDANIGFVAHGQHYTAVSHPDTSKTAPFTQLLGINNHGIAVGFYNDADGAARGFTYDTNRASFTPVQVPGAADGVTATGIADDGDVSGFYTVGKVNTGFVIHNGRFTKLSFGANTNTQALGVNNADRAVGSYVDAAGTTHGFLWSPGSKVVTVDAPNSPGGSVVNGLNNRGQLVGFATDAAGNVHGFLASSRSMDAMAKS